MNAIWGDIKKELPPKSVNAGELIFPCPVPSTVNNGFLLSMLIVISEGTLRLFPAAFHMFWQASPRSFGTEDEEAEPKLRDKMVYNTAGKRYNFSALRIISYL